MLVREYRIVLPMSVEEYHKGHLWSVAEVSRAETGGGEGVEVLRNEPFENTPLFKGEYASGQYTKKIYHINRKVPGLIRACLPRGAMTAHEESWNAYPFCRTVLTNPEYMKDNMLVKIETMHLPDRGTTENAHNLSPELLKLREVIAIDIASNDHLNDEDIDESTDPSKFKSQLTGRGPLVGNWWNECKPFMCCYKLVTINFKMFGFQTLVERWATKSFYARMFTKFNREVFCWMDHWLGLSMEQVRKFEIDVQHELEEARQNGHVRGMTG